MSKSLVYSPTINEMVSFTQEQMELNQTLLLPLYCVEDMNMSLYQLSKDH